MKVDFLEKYGPTAFAYIGSGSSLFLGWSSGMSTVPLAIIGTVMTFGIILAGFSAAQRNMLLSIRGSRVIRRAFKMNQMDRVWSYMVKNTVVGICISTYSLSGFFAGDNLIFTLMWITVASWWVSFALASLMRSEFVMWLILKRYMEE